MGENERDATLARDAHSPGQHPRDSPAASPAALSPAAWLLSSAADIWSRSVYKRLYEAKNLHRRMRLGSFEPLPGPASPTALCYVLLCTLGGEEHG